MYLIAPDVLAEARGLSPILSGIGVAIGCLLWLTGWRWHRFWVVVAVTVAGGIVGLQTGRSSGGHILAMGVLLALAAGLLALELARILAFLGAGTSAWLAAAALFPKGRELWVAFLLGGLLGVLLYRFWMMLLTSFVGVLLFGHSLLTFICELGHGNAAAYAEQHALILNGGGFALTFLGLGAQGLVERLSLWVQKLMKKQREAKLREKILASAPKPVVRSILDRLLFRGKRAA